MCKEFGEGHTMCLSDVGSLCVSDPVTEIGLTDSEKAEMVKLHNDLRRKVATGGESKLPKAANMRKLVWNDDLAVVAQKWADQCSFDHDAAPARLIPQFKEGGVGQNIYVYMSSKDKPGCPSEKGVNKWYDEVNLYNNGGEDFVFDHPWGHFTQLMWADTSEVGCGWAKWTDGKWHKKVVVCDYGVKGNIEETPMYLEGEPCSKCPAGTTCEDGLCA